MDQQQQQPGAKRKITTKVNFPLAGSSTEV
jgi:hypothetical protein